MSKTAAEPAIIFNFGYVRVQSKPGSWRRGYGYYQKEDQVKTLHLTKEGVEGSVKGNFKDAYNVQLKFSKNKVSSSCDCPLEEEWCKHVVAVALESIDNNLWEEYWDLPIADEVVSLDIKETAEDFQGHYRFYFNPQPKQRKIGLKVVRRENGKPVIQLENILEEAVQRQGDLTEYEKREFNVLHLILKHTNGKANHGWFNYPASEAEPLIQALSQVEEVCNPEKQRIIFEQTPLKLLMGVNVSLAGNVLISIHWVRKEPYDSYPLEEVIYFGRKIPWGLYKNHLYPLGDTIDKLPKHLTKSSFTDIRDADGGKFMYEELPRLRQLVQIDEADIIEQLELMHKPVQKIVNLEFLDEATLRIRASLEFKYDDMKVPYSKAAPDTPYVMVVKKKTETIYWIKRDPEAEQDAYQKLIDGGMESIQTNHLTAEGDDAIDFFNLTVPFLDETWTVKHKEKHDMRMLARSEEPLKVWANIDFAESVDAFIMRISCRIGDREMEIDEVRNHLVQGKKYFYMTGLGHVEIPLATMLQAERTLQNMDAIKIDGPDGKQQDVYQIQTFKAGLISELVEQGVELDLSEKYRTFWDLITATTSLEDVPVPDNVVPELRPYQKQGFNWLWFLYSYGLNGILADDMGLGKTLQSQVLLQHAKNEDGPMPTIVICPTSVVYNWANEIRRFTPDLTTMILSGPDRHGQYKKIKDHDVIITSYAVLRRDINALKGYKFRYAILDESQNIKNLESQTARASKLLDTNHRLALSGTPIENRLLELWSVFDFLMPDFLYDVDDFKFRYVYPIEEKGNRGAEQMLKRQIGPFVLRRMKEDVAKDLPPKIESISYCELTEKQRELYYDYLEKTREEVFAQMNEGGTSKGRKSIFAALLRLRQICCHPLLLGEDIIGTDRSQWVEESGKFEALTNMLEDVIANGHRILLFSQFVEMLKIIRNWADRSEVRYEFLTGDVAGHARQDMVDRFNRDDSIPLFLMSLKAGGTGLNLTGADYVIHYDPWWNPAAEDQATDRAHRIGQTRTVFVYRLVARGTVEEKIMQLKDKKRDLFDTMISVDRDVGKSLSFEDLNWILKADF